MMRRIGAPGPPYLGTSFNLSGIVVSLAILLLDQSIWGAISALALFGLFSAPLTIWAQTLRMQIVPEMLRGRTFALLRTLMQSTGPLASAAAGALLPILGIAAMIGFSGLLVGVPGLPGYGVKQLRQPAGEGLSSKRGGETM